jgi:selenide,water dikinase
MLRLNRHAMHLAREAGAHAVTDVTGFAIVGHALEIADRSGVRLVVDSARLPLLPGALDYALAGVEFGGVNRNRNQLGPRVEIAAGVSPEMRALLFDPQTSGGLLIALEAQHAEALVTDLRDAGYDAALIGEARPGAGLVVEG